MLLPVSSILEKLSNDNHFLVINQNIKFMHALLHITRYCICKLCYTNVSHPTDISLYEFIKLRDNLFLVLVDNKLHANIGLTKYKQVYTPQ